MVAPLCKWPGGKTRELPQILAAMPATTGRFVDPFVGGGAVLFAVPPRVPAVVNDASADLVEVYRRVAAGDRGFLRRARALGDWWDGLADVVARHAAPLVEVMTAVPGRSPGAVTAQAAEIVDTVAAPVLASVPDAVGELADPLAQHLRRLVPAKLGRVRRVEQRRGRQLSAHDRWRNVEGAVRASLYTTVRTVHNAGHAQGTSSAAQAVWFLFLREFAYGAMFRFNRRGEFNVPYGGISYNRKSFADRVAHVTSSGVRERLATTRLACQDFEPFLAGTGLRPDDLVFLDPPYDSDFSAYDRTGFDEADHRRLAATIRRLPCRFQLVIKDTPLVRELYLDPAWHVQAFDLRYQWTIKDRNDRAATHLLVTDVAPQAAAVAGRPGVSRPGSAAPATGRRRRGSRVPPSSRARPGPPA